MRRLATACALFAVNVALASCDATPEGTTAKGAAPLRPINALLDAEASAVADELAATRARAGHESKTTEQTDAGAATAR